MEAMVLTEFGPPEALQLREISKPTPKKKEILIRIHATSVNFGDTLIRNFKNITAQKFHMPYIFWLFGKLYFGFAKPKITVLGSEFAGEIAGVGKDVTLFNAGDRVFGYRGPRMGAYAEYLCMSENDVVAGMPKNMAYTEAASVPYGAIMALNLLRKVKIRPGQKVLVNGASGGIGPAVLQLARYHLGANVTGVCSGQRAGYVKSLGAHRIIDYTKEDFSKSGETYDFIFDILGKTTFAQCKRALNPNGRCLLVSFKSKQIIQMFWTSMFGDKKIICALSNEKAADLLFIKELIEAGKFRAFVDRCFPLDKTAEAHRHVNEGHNKGAVVITQEKS